MHKLSAAAWVALLSGLLLQIYLRTYPLIRSGCTWPPHSEGDVKIVAFGDPQITGSLEEQSMRKKVDIYGNDMFLAQIASTVRRHTVPNWVAVMGDLLSSQWIEDDEFYKRVDRYAKIFPSENAGILVNVSGNHDIGYHGEFSEGRLSRFEDLFGALNYVVADTDKYRIVVLNSLCLDGPPYHDEPQNSTLAFLESLRGYSGTSVLLTHIPMYKHEGICRDGPYIDYYEPEFGSVLRAQNHLSLESSKLVLDSVFGSCGGIIVTGHDHEGCFSRYSRQNGEWVARVDEFPQEPAASTEVKEFTVRAMMGEYGGNAGLIRGHITKDEVQWTYTLCRFHVQHIWWIAQILTLFGLSAPILTMYI